MKKIIISCVVLLLTACGSEKNLTLTSPDKSLQVHLHLDEQGQAHYRVEKSGRPTLLASPLGVELSNADFSQGLTLKNVGKPTVVNDSYTMKHGKRRQINYSANERVFTLQAQSGALLQIAFRVSDDGLAFQYRFPGDSETPVVVENELTGFAFPAGSKAWLQHMAVAQTGWANTNPSYEEHYQMGIDVGAESPSPAGWVFPALYRTAAGDWVLLTEAGMDGKYHGSRLQPTSPGGVYRIGYPMAAEVFTGGALKARSPLPFHSPWRIVVVGSLATITESTLGTDLAAPAIDLDPARENDWDWVKPGLAAWSWALLKDDSVNYDKQIEFIDYAAEMGWPYTLVDADWDRKIGYEKIAELARYAAQKNVGLLLWYNSSGDWNKTTYSPKSKLLNREERRREFARLQALGIKGVKIDFFAGDGQSMMAYYHALVRDAADFELLVNYHGSSLPRGLQRTYPNLMTMEAVHGFEMITFNQASADVAAAHMAMQPFTRNAFDPMDFTPTAFSAIPNIEKRTRNGFELALPVVFLSGIQHIAETAQGMQQVPDYVQRFMSDVPVAWDETRFIAGHPGEYAIIARRFGETWYLGAINALGEEKQFNLDLSFIGKRQGTYITDGATPAEFSTGFVNARADVLITLKANGGMVMVFE